MTEEIKEEPKVEEKKCNCTEECTCGCQEGKECTCDDEKCTCGCENEEKECKCEEKCDCKQSEESNCKEEKKKKGIFHKNKHDDKLNEAYNKISELEDKLIRKDAEVVNYRKRREEEFSRMMKFANEGLIKDLLPVIDNFERALSYLHELKNIILNNLSGDKQDLLKQAKWLFEDVLEGTLGVRVLKEESTSSDLQELLNKRNQARKEKNWAVADECRNKLSELGYKIIDNKDGSSTLVKKI